MGSEAMKLETFACSVTLWTYGGTTPSLSYKVTFINDNLERGETPVLHISVFSLL